ncbi:Putative transmembrane protein [Fulvivirga imtechensis AK7]|uniref:Putative transmembrane protein n=1 Tax=Fulvivirga imtechensis AK7 TaxID=1237149 RepID=L8JZ52_9BACT|nr:YeeE/YedE thiosulfate transporter family protein [Fulvivirga imtechensis]ELR73458.1 Putative transmembrane protein [Fulvivirga imtechensis AK7]
MNEFINFISQPWPWYVAGPVIALVMFSLLLLGNSFGISANLRTMCSIFGAGKTCEFFDFNWRSQIWNLIFAGGLIIGGLIAHVYLTPSQEVHISQATINDLHALGVEDPGSSLVPESIFNWESLFSVRGFIMLVVGGFLIGFGTRYAGGCTSGHAISGLSDLQLPSLIAVVGFFIGGLLMTHLVLPHLLTL